MASFARIASGIADRPGVCLYGPTVPPGFETQAVEPSERPARQRGDA